jgi:hypothetical protein
MEREVGRETTHAERERERERENKFLPEPKRDFYLGPRRVLSSPPPRYLLLLLSPFIPAFSPNQKCNCAYSILYTVLQLINRE